MIYFFKKTNRRKKVKQGEQGFVILFAIVVSSIILLVSSGIYTISKKQTILSSYARESQRAFYSANSALECAFFNDISPFITQTAFPVDESMAPGDTTTINCGGRNIVVRRLNVGSTGGAGFTHSFVFRFPNPVDMDSYTSGCAYVLVEKKIGDDNGNGSSELNTRITASGFNTCKQNPNSGFFDIPDFDDPTLLERRISSGYNSVYYVN